jgi:heptosyltransferase I
VIFDRSKGLSAFTDIRRALAAREFDLVINLQVYFKAGVVTSFTRAPVKLGFDRARARFQLAVHDAPHSTARRPARAGSAFRIPHGARRAEGSRDLGPGPVGHGTRLAARVSSRHSIVRWRRSSVATSKDQKDWMPERWADVADALWHDFGPQPVLVGGRSPRELHAEHVIMERAKHTPHSALGSGLRNLVGILDGSSLVLAPDTGPLHMAVALDKPAISLMGYTNPKRTGPYVKFHDLIVDAYGEPGENYPISMENRRDRMPRISVRDVLDRVERWRTRYQSAVTGPKVSGVRARQTTARGD